MGEDGRGWERMGGDGRMEVDGMKISEHSYGVLVVVFFSKKSLPKGRKLDFETDLVGTWTWTELGNTLTVRSTKDSIRDHMSYMLVGVALNSSLFY